MLVPAAVSPAPLAVLVLAWDETTPAVRALFEATHDAAAPVDSVLVMVPQADAPDHFSAEEYLPLPAALAAAPEPAGPALAPAPLPPPLAAAAPPGPAPRPAAPAQQAGSAPVAAVAPAAASPAAAPLPVASTPPTPPAYAAVRVLRLASHSLPELARQAGQQLPAPVWPGAAQPPAAPYLGATPLAAAPPGAIAAPSLAAASGAEAPPDAQETTHALAATPGLAQAASAVSYEPAPAAGEAATPAYALAEAGPQGTLESDLPLAEDEANELEEAPSRDLFQEADFLPSPAQAGWAEALASLRQPAPLATPTAPELATGPPLLAAELAPAALPEPASPAASARPPAATQYAAPNLNFQIIQYARFAVPVALAEADFAAIYAPAWPTWLAAQELRQRTGRPLVLHVAALAAGDQPAGTATGWMADLQRQAMQRADLILTETPALAERLRRELGLPFATVQAVAAADALAIAQALHAARRK